MKIIRSVALLLAGILLFGQESSAALSGVVTPIQAQSTATQEIRFERITVEDGLPHATVLGAAQDPQGFMWFTTQDGFCRYDGYSFTTFRHDKDNSNSLSNNNTFALTISRDGLIWVGTDPGGLNVYDPSTGNFSFYLHNPNDPDSLADDSIWSLLQDQDGSIWVGTRNGLSHLDRETGKFKNYLPDPENLHALAEAVVYRIYQDKAGTVWVGTRNGLQRYNPETDDFTTFQNSPEDLDSLSNNSVWGILEDSQDNFWVATRGGGLNLFNRETGKFTAYRNDPNNSSSIGDDRLWNLYEDRSGNIWIGSNNSGLILFDPETKSFHSFKHNPNDPNTISNNDIFWITEDQSGVMWVTSRYGGINKVYPSLSRFGLYRSIANDSNSLSSNSVYSILSEDNGIVWIGTFGGGLNRYNRQTGKMTVYMNDPEDPTSISSNNIYYIYRDKQGFLWAATSGGGLNRMDPVTGNFTAFRYTADENPPVIDSNYLTTIDSAGEDLLWVGTLGFGLDLFNIKTGMIEKVYAPEEGNPNSMTEGTVYDIAVEKSGKVWIATARGGLELLDPETDTYTHHLNDPKKPNSILSNTVHAIYLDEENRMVWAGTAGGLSGLNLSSGQWQNYTKSDGLPSDTIVGIQPGKGDDLWVSTSKGISHFNIDTKEFINYDARDGLQGDQFEIASSHVGPVGEIFFGGSNGVTYFTPAKITKNTYLPPVVFTDFQLFYETVPVGGETLPGPIEKTQKITLTYNQSVFTIGFAALNYQSSSKNQYQYKLDGFEKDWSPPQTRHEATYTNISPGMYTFMVRAANNDGYWNDTPVTLEIEILPPWWETWWFRILAGSFGVALIAGAMQLRIHNIHAKNIELEHHVYDRTKELRDAQDELQAANDELQRQLKEITMLEQKVREQAMRDALTGLYNRHHLAEVLGIEFNRAQHKGHSIAFLLMDLDHFKSINDVHGHHIGDLTLKATAKVIQDHTRRSDSAFRYGGEEFLLIIPDINKEEAFYRAEELCKQVHALHITYEDKTVHVHTSIGVAIYPEQGSNSDEILIDADQALYKAKRAGGNQVILYNPDEKLGVQY